MSREHDYSNGDVLHAAMMDIVQEMLSGFHVNVLLEQNTSTSVKVTAATGNGQAALTIGGKMRWASANETLTISGGAGTYNIHAIVDTESPGASGSDPASRGFSLEQNNGTPTATSRKIGEVDWSGSSITAVRSTINAINANQIPAGLITSGMLDSGAAKPVVVSFTVDATLSQMANQFVEVDIASSKTATLPASPADGDVITFSDVTGDLSNTITLTIGRNGKLIDGAASNFVITTARTTICFRYNGTEWNMVYRTPNVDVQIFTANGTWKKPSGAVMVEAVLIGAGGGGGSGRRGATGTMRGGGGGGGGGSLVTAKIRPSDLAATELLLVGTGGAGGAAITTNDTNGNNGSSGGLTAFGWGGGDVTVKAYEGLGGAGGASSGYAAGGAATAIGSRGGEGSENAQGTAGSTALGPGAGGGGGGYNASNTIINASNISDSFFIGVSPGSGYLPGLGGTGGSVASVNGVSGALSGYGAGGGGGAGSTNGTTSGAGGAGGNGLAIITTYF